MLKLKLTSNVRKAITTLAYANQYRLASNVSLIESGGLLVRKLLKTYLSEEFKLDDKQQNSVAGEALSKDCLAKTFDSIQTTLRFQPLVSFVTEKTGGMSPKMKVGILYSLAYAAVLDDQPEVLDFIMDEIKQSITFEKNHLSKFDDLLKSKGDDAIKYLSAERFSGTDDKPIFKAVLNYDGVSVEAIGKNKKTAKRRACEKFFQRYQPVE